jgi:hypothetical protein
MTRTQRRAGLLCVLTALGAAGMFLGPGRVLGLDVGAFGGALLYGALLLFLIFVAHQADGVFFEDAALAEREAWVDAVFVALISCQFLGFLAALPGLGPLADQISNPVSRRFGMNLGMFMFGWILAGSVLRAHNREPVTLDERDLRIRHAAGRFANGLMSTMMIGLIVLLCSLPEQSRSWMRPLLVGNTLVGLLIARALAENIYRVVCYCRERA